MALLLIPGAPAVRAQQASGAVRVEIGLDSAERRFYRPVFSFDWPMAGDGRVFASLGFWQRMNGRLRGDIDYWLEAGFEDRISDRLSLEGRLSHFCRHLTSRAGTGILNLNELVGRVRYTAGRSRLEAGFGTYVGGSPGYRHLLVLGGSLAGFPGPDFRLEGEAKWVNFRQVLYEAGLALALSGNAEVFVRAARLYELPPAAYLGVRFGADGGRSVLADAYWISAAAHPYYGLHKLVASGGYRLGIFDRPGRRFTADLEFDAPILSGTSFLGTYWPDRMLHWVSATYDFDLGDGLRAGLYGRYALDMPADRAEPFSARLAVGLAVMNQAYFDRLERPLRFEIRAGYDFKAVYDLQVRLGLNTVGSGPARFGGDVRFQAVEDRAWSEVRAFADLGRGRRVSVRPFIGLRSIGTLAGAPPPREKFIRQIALGLALYGWLDK